MVRFRDRRFVRFVVVLKPNELIVFLFDFIEQHATFGFHLVDLCDFLVQFRLTIGPSLLKLIALFDQCATNFGPLTFERQQFRFQLINGVLRNENDDR